MAVLANIIKANDLIIELGERAGDLSKELENLEAGVAALGDALAKFQFAVRKGDPTDPASRKTMTKHIQNAQDALKSIKTGTLGEARDLLADAIGLGLK